ncbi:hypothetical protein VTO73DRAFT_7570 [Trametes versicolor]
MRSTPASNVPTTMCIRRFSVGRSQPSGTREGLTVLITFRAALASAHEMDAPRGVVEPVMHRGNNPIAGTDSSLGVSLPTTTINDS